MIDFFRKFLLLAVITHSNRLLSQSSLHFGVGTSFTRLKIRENNSAYKVTDEPYSKPVMISNLGFRQMLSPKLSGAIDFYYTKREVNTSSGGIVGYEKIKFNCYATQLFLGYNPNKWFDLGIGHGFNMINKQRYLVASGWYPVGSFRVESSAIGFVQIMYKQVFFRSIFEKGYGHIIDDATLIEPLSALSFLAGYSVGLNKKRNRRG